MKKILCILPLVLAGFSFCSPSYEDAHSVAQKLAGTICYRLQSDCKPFDPSKSDTEQDLQNYNMQMDCAKKLEKDLEAYITQNSVQMTWKQTDDCDSAMSSTSLSCQDIATLITAPPEECKQLRAWFAKMVN